MSGGVAISGLFAYFTLKSSLGLAIATNPAFQIVFMIVWFGFGFFAHKIIEKVSAATGLAIFLGFSAITGMAFAPIIAQYAMANVASAFFVAAATFIGMSMFGNSTKKSLSGWGTFLNFAFIGMIAAIVINIVLGMFGVNTGGFSIILSFAIVPLVAAGIAYELNMLKEQYSYFAHDEDQKNRVAIMSAVSLYTSFVVLFLNILQILGFLGNND